MDRGCVNRFSMELNWNTLSDMTVRRGRKKSRTKDKRQKRQQQQQKKWKKNSKSYIEMQNPLSLHIERH